jgi:hypothetical protein
MARRAFLIDAGDENGGPRLVVILLPLLQSLQLGIDTVATRTDTRRCTP